MSRMGAFRACYEMALAKDPEAKGGVTMAFAISPGGSVASASVASSSLGNARVEGCMLRTFNRLKFPVADKATNSVFPFVFKGNK
jgi:outer membrane biosynthesis protein TonB